MSSGVEQSGEERDCSPAPAPFRQAGKIQEIFFLESASSTLNGHLFWSQETDNIFSTKIYHIELLNSP
jgi:hypothetical protein